MKFSQRLGLQYASFDASHLDDRIQECFRRGKKGVNCFSAAFFLAGIQVLEREIEGKDLNKTLQYLQLIERFSSNLYEVPESSVIIGVVQPDNNGSKPIYSHLALIDPDDHSYVYHRAGRNQPLVQHSFNRLLDIYDPSRTSSIDFLKNYVPPTRKRS
ncbi:hypothetical protein C5B42_02085 [Candidatus Cerribacteria bacterium 'Amazon FNV 2010 28 9']|uniref:Uncharacterized protein n=1 Tax=Candidatus Cerribacteria bacterium 'Amazon FNV 2010 28 9' TaxID=2081795 RepID=A0A317JPB1_9BACT|nr:MAG: hypothetical protein C5B42_02085 [Candidatus Cerribacteria bacterium 'Amazon FNV 2010 28 9']